KPVAKVKKLGSSDLHGTITWFTADPTIFPIIEYNVDRIVAHLRQQAYLVRGLRITVWDLRNVAPADLKDADDTKVFYIRELGLDAPSTTFYFEGGLRSLVGFQNRHQEPIHKTIFY